MNFTPRPNQQYLLTKRLCGPHNRSGRAGEETVLLAIRPNICQLITKQTWGSHQNLAALSNHHRTHQVESGSATCIQGQTSQSNALVLLRAINIYRNDRQFPNYGIRTLVKVKIKSHKSHNFLIHFNLVHGHFVYYGISTSSSWVLTSVNLDGSFLNNILFLVTFKGVTCSG